MIIVFDKKVADRDGKSIYHAGTIDFYPLENLTDHKDTWHVATDEEIYQYFDALHALDDPGDAALLKYWCEKHGVDFYSGDEWWILAEKCYKSQK